jgi:hypothetical protein
VTDQIGLLRVQVDRFMQAYTATFDQLDYQKRLDGLRAITLAVGRLASLERILASTSENLADYDEFQQLMDSIPDEMLD